MEHEFEILSNVDDQGTDLIKIVQKDIFIKVIRSDHPEYFQDKFNSKMVFQADDHGEPLLFRLMFQEECSEYEALRAIKYYSYFIDYPEMEIVRTI